MDPVGGANPSKHRVRRWLVVAGVLLLVVWILWPTGVFDVVLRQRDIDINSGRERERVEVFGIPVSSTEKETPFSQLVARCGLASTPAQWRRFHTGGGSARINYRYGGIRARVEDTMKVFEFLDVPQSEQARLVEAMMRCLRDGRYFHTDADFDSGTIRLTKTPMFIGEHDELLVEYPQPAGR